MKNHVNTLRAIASLYIRDIVRPIFWIVGAISVIVLLLAIWLSYAVSLWWLLLVIPVLLWCIVLSIVGTISWLIVQRLAPRRMKKADREEVRKFISQINGIAELAATPKILVALRVAFDAIFKRNTRYLEEQIHSARDLHKQYASLAQRFHDTP